MLMRNGFLCAAWAALGLALTSGVSLAKPPDLPVDPRIVCPEGREAVPEAETRGGQREEDTPDFAANLSWLLRMFLAGPLELGTPATDRDAQRGCDCERPSQQAVPRPTGEEPPLQDDGQRPVAPGDVDFDLAMPLGLAPLQAW